MGFTSFNGKRVVYHSVKVLQHVKEKKIISKRILLLFFHAFLFCGVKEVIHAKVKVLFLCLNSKTWVTAIGCKPVQQVEWDPYKKQKQKQKSFTE